MKNIAVLVYDLTVECNIVVTDGILDFYKDKGDDFHLIDSALNAPLLTKFDYDYQNWTALEFIKSNNIDAFLELGINVPKNVCNFGFDDAELASENYYLLPIFLYLFFL